MKEDVLMVQEPIVGVYYDERSVQTPSIVSAAHMTEAEFGQSVPGETHPEEYAEKHLVKLAVTRVFYSRFRRAESTFQKAVLELRGIYREEMRRKLAEKEDVAEV